jgi:hypothetical protein
MKTHTRKLSLRTETVRALSHIDLGGVAGGAPTSTFAPTGYNPCTSGWCRPGVKPSQAPLPGC